MDGPATKKYEREVGSRLWHSIFENRRQHRQLLETMESWADPLPAYSGATTCAKCASTAVATRYCKGWHRGDCSKRKYEHIHRDCGTCGFDWLEAPVDGYGPKEELASQAPNGSRTI